MALRRRCISVAKVAEGPAFSRLMISMTDPGPGQSAAETTTTLIWPLRFRFIEGDGNSAAAEVLP